MPSYRTVFLHSKMRTIFEVETIAPTVKAAEEIAVVMLEKYCREQRIGSVMDYYNVGTDETSPRTP